MSNIGFALIFRHEMAKQLRGLLVVAMQWSGSAHMTKIGTAIIFNGIWYRCQYHTCDTYYTMHI